MSRLDNWWLRWVGFVPEHPVLASVAIVGAFVLYFALVYTGGAR
jgi:hypothetical protein